MITQTPPKIYLASPHMSEEGYEKHYIEAAFQTNWIAPTGPNVEAFQDEFKSLVGAQHAVALSSGTAAIHMALRAAHVGPGDIVLCQSLTFAASANPIIYQGATPVFLDSDEATWNVDPKLLKKAIQHYPKIKAIIVVHLYGIPCDIEAIAALCQEHGIVLIEDAAESLGSLYKHQHLGTFGDYGIYSFNGNKIITTSGGGMLVSKHADAIEKVKKWASQARDEARHYEHSELGYNYRMSNVVAGIGRGQLKVLAERVKQKQHIYQTYQKALAGYSHITLMPQPPQSVLNYWLSCLIIKEGATPLEIITALEKDNIESRPLWKPMHLQPYYRNCDVIGGTVSQRLFERGVCLPSDTKMTDEDIQRVIRVLHTVLH